MLEPNNLLQKSERIFENEILGPESIVVDGGERSREFKSTKETPIILKFKTYNTIFIRTISCFYVLGKSMLDFI